MVGEVNDSVGCKFFAHVDRLLACLMHSNAGAQDLHKRLQLKLPSPLVRGHHALAVGFERIPAVTFGSLCRQSLQVSERLEVRAVSPQVLTHHCEHECH